MTINFDNFPIDSLPSPLREAVDDLHYVAKAPIPIVVASLLSAASLVCSPRRRVRRFNDMVSSTALFLILIAESGERKTTCDNIASEPIRVFDTELLKRYEADLATYRIALGTWKAERQGVTTALKRAAATGINCDPFKQRLGEIIAREPVKPNLVSLILRDITPEALVQRLDSMPVAGVFSSEAGSLFQSKTFNNLGMFNIAWDSGALRVDRKNQAPLVVEDPTVTLSIMVQPHVLKSFLDQKGAQARSIGFLARCLIAFPISTQGYRIEQPYQIKTDGLDAFHDWIHETLRDTFSPSGVPKDELQVLEFSWQAKNVCRDFANFVESQLHPNYNFADVRDAASKIGENMARIAAIFHLLRGDEAEISLDTTQAAIAVSEWYLTQFKKLFGNVYVMPEWEKDAQILYAFICNMEARLNSSQFRKNDLRQRAPNRLRNKLLFDSTLNVLVGRGQVGLFMQGKTTMVYLPSSQILHQPAALPGVNRAV